MNISPRKNKMPRFRDTAKWHYNQNLGEINRQDKIAKRTIDKERKFQNHLNQKFQNFLERKTNYMDYLSKHKIVESIGDKTESPMKFYAKDRRQSCLISAENLVNLKAQQMVKKFFNKKIRVSYIGPQPKIR